MKKVFSLVAVALLTVSVLFTSCRDNASAGEAQETPATEAAPAPAGAAPATTTAPDAAATPAADTTKAQQAQ
jgi:hypothetical protein